MKWNKEKIIKEIRFLENKLQRRPLKKDNSNLYCLSRKYFGTWNKMMAKAGYDVKFRQDVKIPKFSNKLSYFFGLLCTDGHIQFLPKKGKYKLIIFTSNQDEKIMIIKLIKDLFNYDASIRSKTYGFSKRPNYEIYISSKKLCQFCNSFGIPYGKKSDIIRIPKKVMGGKRNFVSHFIRGVFDGDGSIIRVGNQNLFKINMGSKNFIHDLNALLIKLDINSARIRQERINLWDLRINKKEDIKKLYFLLYQNNFGCFYPRKRNKWKQYI